MFRDLTNYPNPGVEKDQEYVKQIQKMANFIVERSRQIKLSSGKNGKQPMIRQFCVQNGPKPNVGLFRPYALNR